MSSATNTVPQQQQPPPEPFAVPRPPPPPAQTAPTPVGTTARTTTTTDITPEEQQLLTTIEGLFEKYATLLQQTKSQHVAPPLVSALSELLIQQRGSQRLVAPGLYALPVVPKRIQIGPRGGVRYINSKGNIIWLKKNQKKKCQNGTLEGAVGGCNADQE